MASCVRNIRTKNYQNLVIDFQVTVKNVGDVFFGTECIYMAVNKMLNLIDFEHLQTVLLSVAYARIKTFSSIAGGYYDNKIINVKTPKLLPYVMQVIAKKRFAANSLTKVKMVADRHRHAADHNKHWRGPS